MHCYVRRISDTLLQRIARVIRQLIIVKAANKLTSRFRQLSASEWYPKNIAPTVSKYEFFLVDGLVESTLG